MKVASEELDGSSPLGRERGSARGRAGRILQFVVAVLVAALVTRALIGSLPNLLPARTDIVGYPIHHPFDVRHYYAAFGLWMVFFPALATIGYALLGRLRPHSGLPRATPDPSVDTTPSVVPSRGVGLAGASAALLFSTVPLALATGVVGAARAYDFEWVTIGAALAATLVGVAIALLVRAMARVPMTEVLWAVASIAAPCAFLALCVLSAETGITVLPAAFRSVTWFPWWIGVPAALVGIAIVGRILTLRPPEQWRSVGRWALVVFTVPTVLWMMIGRISAGGGTDDLFHNGELLVGTQLLLDGGFPWRDFISTHGVLLDSLQSLPGLTLVDHSIWGAATGTSIWAVPAYWISSFAFAAYLFRRNVWLLIPWCALIVASPLAGSPVLFFPATPLFVDHFRSLLYPLILLAMAWLVRRPSSSRAALIAGLLVVQAALTPEMAYLVPALFATLIAFDWTRHPGVALRRRFPTTLLTGLWSGGFVLLFAAFLWANGALGSFIDYFRIFASGHELTGGIPITGDGAVFGAAVYLPPVLFLISIWYVISRVRGRRPLERDDWVLLPVLLFGVLYYTKFLARADVHVLHSFAVITPLLWYIVARVLANADRLWSRRGALGRAVPHGATAVAVVVVLALLAPSIQTRLDRIPDRYRTSALERSSTPRLGYTNRDGVTVAYGRTAADANSVIRAIAPGNPKVFDFTNTPTLYYFTLGLRPPTRFYHVSMAIPKAAQRELVDELEESRPQVVVGAGGLGLESWDGIPNMVRHYDVNRYILTHYRAVVDVGGIVYLLRNDLPFDPASIDRLSLSVTPQLSDLDEKALQCDWGAAPERFAPAPEDGTRSTGRLQLTPVDATVTISGWAADPATARPLERVVALNADGTVLASVAPGEGRPDVAGLPGLSGALNSGFHLAVPVAAGEALTVAGRRADGTLVALDGASNGIATVRPGTEVQVGGSRVPVAATSAGFVEQVAQVDVPARQRAARLTRPGSATDWNWLRLRAPRDLAAGRYTVGTPAGDGSIRFRMLSDARRGVDVMVGACNQWYDESAVMVVSYPAQGPVPSVELFR